MISKLQRTASSAAFSYAAVCLKILVIVCLLSSDVFSAESGTEKAVEKAAEKAAEMAVDKAEEKAVEKAELKAQRPEGWWETTKVYFHVFVIDILSDADAHHYRVN